MASIAHAIVGYGLDKYFINAIKSVLEHTTNQPIYVIATGGISIKVLATNFSKYSNIIYGEVPHMPIGKTGALYCAYSQIFAHAYSQGITHLNLFQNDMQLMWWDKDIENHYLSLLDQFPNCIIVNTGFIRYGSHPLIYNSKRLKRTYLADGTCFHYNSTGGWCDWGFIDLKRFYQSNIPLSGYETSFSKKLFRSAYRLIHSSIPSVVPIPWPAVIRGGVEQGTMIDIGHNKLLAPKDPNSLQKLKSFTKIELWQEDWIGTYGWYALEPTWATDNYHEYISIAKQARKCGVARKFVYTTVIPSDSIPESRKSQLYSPCPVILSGLMNLLV